MAQLIDVVAQTGGDDQPSRPTPPGSTSLGQVLRRVTARWPVIVGVAVVAALLAALVTLVSSPTYASSALVRLSASSEDSTRTQQIAQTVERTTVSTPVIDAAAAETGSSPDDLQQRVTALWESDTDVVEVTVRGSDPDQAIDEANAVLDSLQQFYDDQTRLEIEELSRQGDELLSAGVLDEDSAEDARRAGVGTVLADRQGAAAAGWATVTPLEPATEAVPVGLTTPIAGALGGFVGLVAAAGIALLLPFRRRRIKGEADIALVAPGVPVLRSSGVGAAELAGLFLNSDRSALAMLAVHGGDGPTLAMASDVTVLLRAHGVPTGVMDATDQPDDERPVRPDGRTDLTPYKFLGQQGRADAMQQQDADALVIVASSRPETISLLAGQPDVYAAVAVPPSGVRAAELQRLLSLLRHSRPVVVLLS